MQWTPHRSRMGTYVVRELSIQMVDDGAADGTDGAEEEAATPSFLLYGVQAGRKAGAAIAETAATSRPFALSLGQ